MEEYFTKQLTAALAEADKTISDFIQESARVYEELVEKEREIEEHQGELSEAMRLVRNHTCIDKDKEIERLKVRLSEEMKNGNSGDGVLVEQTLEIDRLKTSLAKALKCLVSDCAYKGAGCQSCIERHVAEIGG